MAERITLQTAYHGSTSPRFASTQRNHGSWPASTDFCNKIRQERKSASDLQLAPTCATTVDCFAEVRSSMFPSPVVPQGKIHEGHSRGIQNAARPDMT